MKLFQLYSVIIDKSFWTVEIITLNYVPTAGAFTAQNQCFCASHADTGVGFGGWCLYVQCGPCTEGKGVCTDMVVEGTFWRGRNPQRKV